MGSRARGLARDLHALAMGMGESAEYPGRGMRRARHAIEIDADVERVFGQWSRLEDLPRIMEGVRHVQRIDARRSLWDVDIAGRQVVWEAEVVECVPLKRIRWASRRGAANVGEVAFEELPGGRTLLTVDLCYGPRGFLEGLGARLGLVDRRIEADLARLRHAVERR